MAAYLMRTERLSAAAALAEVAAARPEVNPNPGFVAQLHEYERTMMLHPPPPHGAGTA